MGEGCSANPFWDFELLDEPLFDDLGPISKESISITCVHFWDLYRGKLFDDLAPLLGGESYRGNLSLSPLFIYRRCQGLASSFSMAFIAIKPSLLDR